PLREAELLRQDVAVGARAVDDDQRTGRGAKLLREAREVLQARRAVRCLVGDDAAAQLHKVDALTPGPPSCTTSGCPPRFAMAAAHASGSSVKAIMLPPPPEPVSFAP